MDYEKAYKEMLGVVKELYPSMSDYQKEKFDGICSELKDSEDERVRNEIIDYILYKADGISEEQEHSWISYLEKRKEQSITANDLDEEVHRFFDDCIVVHEAKLYGNISERVIPVDCYELTARHFAKWGEKHKEQKPVPKFKVGDCIYDKKDSYNRNVIREVGEDYYINAFAQKMDMAYTDANFEFLEHLDNDTPDSKPSDVSEKIEELCSKYPLNKDVMSEQVLSAYHQGLRLGATKIAEYLGVQKPAEWSEEDKTMLNNLIWAVHMKSISPLDEMDDRGNYERYEKFLTSLPERFNLQPKQEWSDEDRDMLNSILLHFNAPFHNMDKTERLWFNWLQSLPERFNLQPKQESEPIEIKYAGKIYKVYGTKEFPGGVVGYKIEDEPGHFDCIINPDEVLGGGYDIKSKETPYPAKEANLDLPHWKPSEEQMRAVFDASERNDKLGSVLRNLYNDLKKLM